MDILPETGSIKAVPGYASCYDNSVQFFENRSQRMSNDNNIDDDDAIKHPKIIFDYIKEENDDHIESFQLLSKISKYASQISADVSNQ